MVNHIISYRRNCNHLLHLQDQHQQMYLPLQTHCSPRSPMCNFYQSVTFRFRNISFFGFSIRKKIGINKIIGFGFGKIWYRKKVFDLVSFRFWVFSVSKLLGFNTFPISRWYRIRYRKKFGIEKSISFVIGKIWCQKSFGFGFVQILGIVTH